MIFTGMLIALVAILTIIMARSITTFIHELGHAIPALLFTDDDVVICLGSYGDVSDSWCFDMGRLKIYFQLNILSWQIGICAHEKPESVDRDIAIVLGGPIATLLLFFSLVYALSMPMSDNWKFVLLVFMMSGILDFIVNICLLYTSPSPRDA